MDGMTAERRRRWGDAVRGYTTVVAKVPAFGFARDRRIRRALQRAGYKTMWVWEHELSRDRWVKRLRRAIAAGAIA